ncbi:MAG: serine hydrolase [Crocinitomicaceae bacterium]|jgi:CubicO group peptidase (beta-lactamase class C family)|nr:serine hydrolase [Crocinitomicaceae bacterium]
MKSILLLLGFLLAFSARTQELYFPPLAGTTWETIDPLSLGYCQDNIDVLHDYLEETNSKAFIMLKDGKIVFEWYYGTFTRDSFYVWNSAGKTLTAMAVGIAQREGYLELTDTTSHYLGTGWTSLTPAQEEKITIWHQLTMTSGLGHTGDHYCTDPECLVYEAEPGTRWSYHNGPYTLLDGVIEAATGVNLTTYVNQKIRSKIGMNGFFYPVDYNNVNLSNARSMARFGLLMLAEGNWNGTPVLDDPAYFQAMTNTSQPYNPSYGYLTWLNGKGSYMIPSSTVQFTVNTDALPNAPDDAFAAMGKNAQVINVVPSQNVVVVRMGEHDGTSLIGNEYNDSIWRRINLLPCVQGSQEIHTETFSLYPNPAQDYLVIKSAEAAESVEIIDIQGKSYAQKPENGKLDLRRFEPGVYFLKIAIADESRVFRFIKQ